MSTRLPELLHEECNDLSSAEVVHVVRTVYNARVGLAYDKFLQVLVHA